LAAGSLPDWRFPGGVPPSSGDIAVARKGLEAMLAPQVSGMRKQYPVDVVDQTIEGILTCIVTPKDKAFDRKHILVNLHGGAFSLCADACAMRESDTVTVPAVAAADVTGSQVAPGQVRIKLYFPEVLAGDIPFHCHLVDHEDNGMMGVLRVMPRGGASARHMGAMPGKASQ
jgi:hypothetical protein